jgi:predicted nucleic acid-binding protein
MNVYLDTCSLHRPLDNKGQVRIALEAEAILAILAMCEAGVAKLISSEVLEYEVEQNPYPQRKAFVYEVLAGTTRKVELTDTIEQRANSLEARGFKAIDALHLASAEEGHAKFFCTCDDRLLRKAKTQADLKTSVVSPLELAREMSQ